MTLGEAANVVQTEREFYGVGFLSSNWILIRASSKVVSAEMYTYSLAFAPSVLAL